MVCFLGVKVQHALKKSDSALETLNRAIGIDPKNPLCKFHRASILFANDKYKVTAPTLLTWYLRKVTAPPVQGDSLPLV